MAEVKKQYAVVVRDRDIVMFRIDILKPEPCRNFKKFTGKRSSTCMCRPCMDKYLEACKVRGQKVAIMPEGWSPI